MSGFAHGHFALPALDFVVAVVVVVVCPNAVHSPPWATEN